MRKVVDLDPGTLQALERLAADQGTSARELIRRAVSDLLRKHRQPVTVREMFAASAQETVTRKK